MSHNLDLFMLTPGFCLQPANKKNKFAINYELSEKNCYSCFQENFSNKDWRHAYRVYINWLRSCIQEWWIYIRKNLSALSNYIIQDIIA